MSKASGQLHLFGEPPRRERPGAGVGPASVPEELERLAAALPRNLWLGTSSWSFPGWAGLVYDREAKAALLARRGLAAYARHPLLRAVGIDRTFYAPLPAEALAAYAAEVPDEFRFLVKAPAQCTSARQRDPSGRATRQANPHFLDPVYAADEAVGPYVEGLGPKGGALVFQHPPLPPELVRDPPRFAARLGAFLAALPRGPVYAVELRDRELVGSDYFATLEAVGARHCLSLHPRMPPVGEQLRHAPESDGPLVGRWMLHATQHYEGALERYGPFSRLVDEDPQTREGLAELCARHARAGREVLITANNKAEGSAPLTVFKLAHAIATQLGTLS